MRSLLVVLFVLCLAGCGDDEQHRSESADRACPEGTPSLQARDVIGTTPDGYRVVEGDPAAIGRVAENVKQTMGPAFRDYDAMSVGDADGRLYQSPDGGWVAVAPAGDCAMVMLVSDREELIRDAATLVMNDA